MRAIRRLAAIVVLVVFAVPVRAQGAGSAWDLGFGLGGFLPSGPFGDHADASLAWDVFVTGRPSQDSPWGGRLALSYSSFAHSDTTYDLPGLSVDTRTSSDLIALTLGPELLIGQGPARLLLHAGVGAAWVVTTTSVRSTTSDVGNTNRSDASFAWEGGAGVSWIVWRPWRVALEASGRWIGSGTLDVVPESGIRRAAGALVLTPERVAVSGVLLRAAVSVRLGRPRRP